MVTRAYALRLVKMREIAVKLTAIAVICGPIDGWLSEALYVQETMLTTADGFSRRLVYGK